MMQVQHQKHYKTVDHLVPYVMAQHVSTSKLLQNIQNIQNIQCPHSLNIDHQTEREREYIPFTASSSLGIRAFAS